MIGQLLDNLISRKLSPVERALANNNQRSIQSTWTRTYIEQTSTCRSFSSSRRMATA